VTTAATPAAPATHWRRFRVLYLLIAVCAAPVLASYYLYYFDPPAGRTNYGELVQPQRPVPAGLPTTLQDGSAFDLRSLRGNWVMVMADHSACAADCQAKLWKMRQLRAASGKDAERIERVFLVLDNAPMDTQLLREYDGTHFLRAPAAALDSFLALPPGGSLRDHIWMIDPISNQMLRWPRDADPKRVRNDLKRLLKASRIG